MFRFFSFIIIFILSVFLCSAQDSVKVIVPDTSGLITTSVFADIGYGIKENRYSSASMKQVLSGKNINPSRQNNINNILAGKIGGLKFYGQSDMALGRTGSVSLRGQSGFSTGQGPVYIVDGIVLSDINDINYNEIEDVTVLPGPSSSAFLGSRGSNGAMIITTKKTSGDIGRSEIELNSGIKISKVSILPDYQDSYAGGYVMDLYLYQYRDGIDPVEWASLNNKFYHDYSDDSSWGPRMAGQEYIPWYSWYPGTKYTGTTARLLPQPDNVRDFYTTGITISNSIAFSRSVRGFSMRASFENIDIKGLIPYTSLKKNNLGIRASFNITERMRIESNINFFTRLQEGEIDDSYGNNTTGTFNQWFHRDLDMNILKELRELRSPTGSYAGWNHNNPTSYDPEHPFGFYMYNYWPNSYTWLDQVDIEERKDRLSGTFSFKWSPLNGIDLKINYRMQESSGWSEKKSPFPTYTWYDYGYFSTGSFYSSSDNLEGLASIRKEYYGISLNADFGFDFYSSLLKSNGANTLGGLSVQGLYAISNSRSLPGISNSRSKEKQNSLFLRSDIGYRNLLFVDLVLRKEYHSALPPFNNSLIAKSIGGSFIFSRLLSMPFLNFGKVRITYGEIPNTIGVYTYPGLNYQFGQYQWSGNQVMSSPDNLISQNIAGSVKREVETGMDIGLFNNRIDFSLTWWKGKESRIPVTVQVAEYSGFKNRMINSGIIDKSGIDFMLNLEILKSENFKWHSCFIISKLIKQEVTRIADGITFLIQQSNYWSETPSMVLSTGKAWGELYGSGMKVDSTGKPYISYNEHFSNVNYVADPKKYFGSVVPKLTGGMQNSLQIFNNLVININLDYQVGGKFFSLSDMWGTYSGLTARTAVLNDKGNPVRDPVTDGGGVHVIGVDATLGNPVDYYVEAQEYFHNLYNDRIYDGNVYDASYLKLRELSIDYRLPLKKLRLDGIVTDATISLFTQNPWMICASQRNFDPSELSTISGEQGQFPGVRSFGMNIKFIF